MLSAPTQPPKSSGKLIIFLVIILIVLLAAFAAFYFYTITSSPETVVKKMLLKMSQVNSFHLEQDVSLLIGTPEYGLDSLIDLTPEYEFIDIDLNLSGDIDNSDKEQVKAELSADLDIKSEDEELGFSGDLKFLNDKIYFNWREFPPDAPEQIENIRNQWISFDLSLGSQGLPSSLPFSSFLNLSKDQDLNLSKQQKQSLEKVFSDFQFVKITEVLDQEKIGQVKTHHYKFKIDLKQLNSDLQKALLLKEEDITIEQKIQQNKLEDLFEILDFLEKSTQKFEGEVNIGVADSYLYAYKLNISVEDPKESYKANLKIDAKNSKFNQPVKIEEPAESKSFQQLYQELLY